MTFRRPRTYDSKEYGQIKILDFTRVYQKFFFDVFDSRGSKTTVVNPRPRNIFYRPIVG
jgi:hypothetical protein